MINKTTKTTRIFDELSEDDRLKYFNYSEKSYISHIDTLYFVAYVGKRFAVKGDVGVLDVGCWGKDCDEKCIVDFLARLEQYKAVALETKKPVEVFEKDVFMSCRSFELYKYNISVKDKFDIFISDYLPNKDTPPIFVQLRSASLWLDGVYNSVDIACDLLDKILLRFGLGIIKVKENRVDYAYHTNYIQDVLHFFPIEKLGDMQVSNFKRWQIQGYFYDGSSVSDYFTLGRRKSNNLFFRVYDKTKEVIEMGYKHFFIPIWLNEGLINQYDFEILTMCAEMGNSWDNIEKCRAIFYLKHGQDYELKCKLSNLIANPDTLSSEFTKLLKGVVPKVTTVCNIEFQVKRKFFSRLTIKDCDQSTLDEFNYLFSLFNGIKVDSTNYRYYLYNFIGQTKSITNFITKNTIRFVRYKSDKDLAIPKHKREMADFWKRLRACEPYELSNIGCEYCRTYQQSIDKELILNGLVSKMAIYAAYNSFADDVVWTADEVSSDVLNHLNDNDLCYKYFDKSMRKAQELRSFYLKHNSSNIDDFDIPF